jgi:hypothetical protein
VSAPRATRPTKSGAGTLEIFNSHDVRAKISVTKGRSMGREQNNSGTGQEEPTELGDDLTDPVQEADEESFPASDAPSTWSGGDARPASD